MKRLKVAVIVGQFPKISETFIINHVVALLKAGHDVTVFSTDYSAAENIHDIVEEYNILDKTVYRPNPHIGYKRLGVILKALIKYKYSVSLLLKSFSTKYYGSYGRKGYFFFELLPYLEKKKPRFDIVHSHFGPNAGKTAFLLELGVISGNHICTFHGHDVNDYREVDAQFCYKYLLNRCDGAIFVVDYVKDKFLAQFKPKFPTYKLPVSVDVEKFNGKEYDETKVMNFITVGRLISWKGQKETIEAFEKVQKLDPSFKFVYHVVGAGPESEDLERLVKDKNLQEIVKFYGALSHGKVAQLLKTSDVFILFGKKDQYGNIDAQGTVVQEAQAVGLPVIVSNGGGLPEGMLDKVSGLVVKENSIDELVEAILYFKKNPEQIKVMGTKGRLFVKEHYSEEVVYEKLFQIYEEVMSK